MSDREKQWERVQIKGFTAWINSYLQSRNMPVQDLSTDLNTGVRLCNFCEVLRDRVATLSKSKLQRWERNPTIRVHFIENTNSALKFVKEELKVKLVGIGGEDIVDGNIKLILGLLWSVFRKLRDMNLDIDENAGAKAEEQALLNWVRKMTEGYRDVEIKGFKDSFHDGMALNALVHRFDPNLVNYDNLDKNNKEPNLNSAFALAEKHLGIPQLLEAQDLVKMNPDERSVVFYISLFFHAFVADAERRAIIEARTRTEQSAADLKAKLEAEVARRAAAEKEKADLERKIRELMKEIDDLKQRLHLEHLLHLDRSGDLEEKIQALRQLLENEGETGKDAEERARRLRAELEEAYRAREELEQLRKKLEAEGSDLLNALREAEEQKKRMRQEIDDLKRRIKQELERRKRKAKAALEMEQMINDLKRQALVQGKARSGLEVLKKNLEEHLEDMYKWRDLHQLDENKDNAPEVFDLQKVVDELQKKKPEDQLDVLNSKLQSENANLQRMIRMKDMQQELHDTVDKHGWLEVRGLRDVKSKDWKKQWFVLRGANLVFYKSEDSDRPAGTIPMGDAQLVTLQPDDDRKFLIGLTVEDKTVTLAAASQKEASDWRAVLNGEIVHLKYLQSIEKDKTHRPDTRLVNLFKSTNVPSVFLDGYPIKVEEVDALAKAVTQHELDTLSLTNAKIGDSEPAALAKALPSLRFRVLKLSGNALTGRGAAAVAKALVGLKNVTEVHLDGNKIDDAGAQAVAELLAVKDSKLVTVNLTDNEVGDAGASAVARALASGSGVRQVLLGNNNIGNGGAAAIADVLKSNHSVTSVQLGSNNIGDQGAQALAAALNDNESVSDLDLSDNNIGNAGALAVQNVLKNSKGLNSVNLSGNKAITGGAQLASFLADGFVFPSLAFTRINPV